MNGFLLILFLLDFTFLKKGKENVILKQSYGDRFLQPYHIFKNSKTGTYRILDKKADLYQTSHCIYFCVWYVWYMNTHEPMSPMQRPEQISLCLQYCTYSCVLHSPLSLSYCLTGVSY